MPDYSIIEVESFIPEDRSAGLHGEVHIRPCPGQGEFLPEMMVQCSKDLSSNQYAVGQKFKIKAKITCREGGKPFVYSSFKWAYTVL